MVWRAGGGERRTGSDRRYQEEELGDTLHDCAFPRAALPHTHTHTHRHTHIERRLVCGWLSCWQGFLISWPTGWWHSASIRHPLSAFHTPPPPSTHTLQVTHTFFPCSVPTLRLNKAILVIWENEKVTEKKLLLFLILAQIIQLDGDSLARH